MNGQPPPAAGGAKGPEPEHRCHPMTDCYRVSLQMIEELKTVVPAVARQDRDLADQLKRAATSVVLNVAEGRLRQGGDQRRCFQIAAGS